MANELEFRLIIKERTCETLKEFNSLIDGAKAELINIPSYLTYIIDNGNDPKHSNKALLLRFNSGEPQVFYNSMDTFSKNNSPTELATSSDNGLFSSYDYVLLRNLDTYLNITDTTNTLAKHDKLLNELFTKNEEESTYKKDVYNINENAVSNFKLASKNMEDQQTKINDITTFLGEGTDEGMGKYTTLSEYIKSAVNDSINNILNQYINHIHN